MIFINNSADYSGLGIGKAPIITEKTKELLAGFPNVTKDEMQAFQDFMYNIGDTDGAIWNALDRIYFPIFAHGVLKDAFFELKSGNVVYPNTSVNDGNVANNWELTTGGVKVLSVITSLTEAVTNIEKSNDDAILFALSEPQSAGGKFLMNYGEVGTSSAGNVMKVVGGGNVNQIQNTLAKDIVALLNFKDTTSYSFGSADVVSEKTNASYSPTIETKAVAIGLNTVYTTNWPSGMKLYGIGDGLSVENARILGNAIVTFNNAMASLS